MAYQYHIKIVYSFDWFFCNSYIYVFHEERGLNLDEMMTVAPEAGIKGMDKYLHPQYFAGCNVLSLLEIPDFGARSSNGHNDVGDSTNTGIHQVSSRWNSLPIKLLNTLIAVVHLISTRRKIFFIASICSVTHCDELIRKKRVYVHGKW